MSEPFPSHPHRPSTGPAVPDDFFELAERVTGLIRGYLETQGERRITDPTPVGALRRLFDEPLPRRGVPWPEVLDAFEQRVMPHTTVSTSPGYFGLMNPTPFPIGIFAEALAAALNQNQAASHHSPGGTVVEETVVRWLGEAVGYDGRCSGHLTSGGTFANLTALKLALHRAAPEVRGDGLVGVGRRFAVYTSDQVHFSLDRAVDVLGLGAAALRKLPARPDATLDPALLRERMAADRKAGWEPLAVVGIAGTTAAGAIDPLAELAAAAAEAGAWFHVDAAYGGAIGLSRTRSDRLDGITRADSVTVDAHKWFAVPFLAGGLLHRVPDLELAAFTTQAGYLPDYPGQERPTTDYWQRGIAGSRRFDALKVWMTLKTVGADGYADLVDRQLDLTDGVAGRIEETPEWSVAVPPATAIITFRYEPPDLIEDLAAGGPTARQARRLRDELQDWIAATVQREGRFWISSAPLPAGKGLRLNVISHRTGQAELASFLDGLSELGRRARTAVI